MKNVNILTVGWQLGMLSQDCIMIHASNTDKLCQVYNLRLELLHRNCTFLARHSLSVIADLLVCLVLGRGYILFSYYQPGDWFRTLWFAPLLVDHYYCILYEHLIILYNNNGTNNFSLELIMSCCNDVCHYKWHVCMLSPCFLAKF